MGKSDRPSRVSWLVGVAVLLTGCIGHPAPPHPPPAFDLSAVKERLSDECRDPVIVDAELCAQVKISEMIGERDMLWVLTNLDPAPNDRLDAICEQIARAQFGAYATVIVIGEHRGNRGCTVAGGYRVAMPSEGIVEAVS